MSLAARLAKLEASHKQILRCPLCRCVLVPVYRKERKDRQSGAPNGKLSTKCWYCGTRYSVSLTGLNRHQREAKSLIYTSHPSRQFIDERVHAAVIWYSASDSQVNEYQKAREQLDSKDAGRNYSRSVDGKVRFRTSTREERRRRREREELKRQAIEFLRVQMDRTERLALAKGPESFPLDETIKQIQEQYDEMRYRSDFTKKTRLDCNHPVPFALASSLELCVPSLRKLKQREACENVLWGAALPDTLREIKFFEQEIEDAINGAVEAHEREEREEEALRLEQQKDCDRYQRDEEARRRERLRSREQLTVVGEPLANDPCNRLLTLDEILRDNEGMLGPIVRNLNRPEGHL